MICEVFEAVRCAKALMGRRDVSFLKRTSFHERYQAEVNYLGAQYCDVSDERRKTWMIYYRRWLGGDAVS